MNSFSLFTRASSWPAPVFVSEFLNDEAHLRSFDRALYLARLPLPILLAVLSVQLLPLLLAA